MSSTFKTILKTSCAVLYWTIVTLLSLCTAYVIKDLTGDSVTSLVVASVCVVVVMLGSLDLYKTVFTPEHPVTTKK